MPKQEEIVSFLNDMVDALTWKRAGLMTLLGSVLVILLMAYENRTTLFDRVYAGNKNSIEQLSYPWAISESTRADLSTLMRQNIVGGVSVTEVNLRKNRRIIKYWDIKDQALRAQLAPAIENLLPQPLFDSIQKNNDQMIAVLNNQFVCQKTDDSVYHIIPDLSKNMPWLCRLAVPPYVGEFAGFITIGLVRQPQPTEIEALKIELTRISIELYLRDVARRDHLGK